MPGNKKKFKGGAVEPQGHAHVQSLKTRVSDLCAKFRDFSGTPSIAKNGQSVEK